MEYKYLIAWPKHGLGDRLKLIASAWAAADSMNRMFAIRWTSGKDCFAEWHNLFKPILPVFYGDNDRCYEEHNHQDLFHSGKLRRYEGREVNHLKDSDHRWIEACAGYFCNGWNYKFLLQPYMKTLVRPLDHIQDKVDTILSKFTGNTLGIHIRVRYGGSVTKVIPKIEEFIDTYQNGKVFICTDTPEDSTKFKRYGDRILMLEQFHKNRTVEGMSEALADFVLLSRCNEMVGTKGSSFSEMAEILNETQREIILI